MRWKLSCAFIIFIALVIQFYVTQCGLLLTHDSREYLSAAKSFAENGTLTGSDGAPYVFWPPLFPVFLSLFAHPEAVMVWINLVLSGVVGILVARLASQHLSDLRLRTGYLIAWMLGVHQLLISVFLWSELVFLVLLLCFAEQVIRAAHSPRALALAFLLGFLLCLQRNAGLFIVPAAALWLTFNEGNKLRSIGRATVVFLSTAGGIWWNVANMYGSVRTRVSDLDYFSAVLDNVLVVTDGIAQSILPFTIFSIPIALVVFMSPIVLIWPTRRLSDHFLLMALICCFYLAGMSVLFQLDPGDADRYSAVILPFLLLMVFRSVENIYRKPVKMIRTILFAGMICWLAYPLLRTAKNALQWHEVSCNESVDS